MHPVISPTNRSFRPNGVEQVVQSSNYCNRNLLLRIRQPGSATAKEHRHFSPSLWNYGASRGGKRWKCEYSWSWPRCCWPGCRSLRVLQKEHYSLGMSRQVLTRCEVE